MKIKNNFMFMDNNPDIHITHRTYPISSYGIVIVMCGMVIIENLFCDKLDNALKQLDWLLPFISEFKTYYAQQKGRENHTGTDFIDIWKEFVKSKNDDNLRHYAYLFNEHK